MHRDEGRACRAGRGCGVSTDTLCAAGEELGRGAGFAHSRAQPVAQHNQGRVLVNVPQHCGNFFG